MALVKYATPVEEIRGSIGGTTFTRSRAGTIARIRNSPRRPISAPLALVKPYLASAVRAWYATLTQLQRDAWNTLGDSTIWQNSLGQDYNPSGHNLYVRVHTFAQWADFTPPTEAPGVADEADPGMALAYDGSRWIRITDYGTLSSPPEGRLVGWKSPELPPQRLSHNHPWTWFLRNFISTLPGPPWNIHDLGAVHPDTRMFFRFRVYRQQDIIPPRTRGRMSHLLFHQVFAAAAP